LYDDLSLSMSLMEMKTKNEKIESSIIPFLEENAIYGVDTTLVDWNDLFSLKKDKNKESKTLKNYVLLNKTILSPIQLENTIYYNIDGKYRKMVLDDAYQEKYQEYLLENERTIKK